MRIANGFFLTLFLGGLFLIPGCHKDEPPRVPEITTIIASKISERSAESGANVTSDGGSPVTQKGVCWSTSPSPTVADEKDEQGPGTGRFRSFVISLTGSTVYYVRGYAINSLGIGYGDEISFKTLAPPPPAPAVTGSVADKEGNVYVTKKIGSQTWMLENLKTSTFSDGSILPLERSGNWFSLTTPAYCWVQNDDSRTIIYGNLYNYYSVTDVRNLCPPDWHVPTLDEWKSMINSLGGDNVAGGKMKEIGTAHWTEPNEGATNSSGFNARPSGIRDQLAYSGFLIAGYFWSSTSLEGSFGQILSVRYSGPEVLSGQYAKTAGASVRCVHN